MANHKSAAKRVRQNEKRRLRNRRVVSNVRTLIKKVRVAIDENNGEAAKALLPDAVRALSRAADKGIIHRNNASRRIGRLTQSVNGLS
ncbi:MAG: 30S ribosomal protein S20 [Myxococcales bacterium]|nr:30S ribosomal protein S20 [Myxococcales bacterium]